LISCFGSIVVVGSGDCSTAYRGALPRTPGFFEAWTEALDARVYGPRCRRRGVADDPRAMPPALVLADGFRRLCFDYPSGGLRPRRARFAFRQRGGVRALFEPRFLIGLDEGLLGFVAVVVPPVGLHEHGVDLFEIDAVGLVANGVSGVRSAVQRCLLRGIHSRHSMRFL
jgi:hypothetical protein